MIENKDIKFRVLYEDWGAANKMVAMDKAIDNTTKTVDRLSQVNRTSNQLLMSTGRIVQDLPFGIMGVGNNLTFLAEQFQNAKANGIGFGEALKGMLVSMTGIGGITFAISLLVSGLTTMSKQSNNTNKTLENFVDILDKAKSSAKSLKEELQKVGEELKKEAAPSFWQKLFAGGSSDPNNVLGYAIRDNKKTAKYLSNSILQNMLLDENTRQNTLRQLARDIAANYGKTLGDTIKKDKLSDEDLGSIKDYLEDELKLLPRVSDAYKHYHDAIKQVDDLLSDKSSNKGGINSAAKERLNEFNDMLKEMYDTIMKTEYKIAHGQLQPKSPWGVLRMGKVPEGKDSNTDFFDAKAKKQWLEENKFMVETLKDSLDIIKGEFSTLWQDVFDEANSLFEKLLMNFASRLAERGISSLFGSLLNFIFPGAGMALGAISGGDRGRTQPIVLKVDDRVFAEVVQESLNNADMYRIKS